MMKKISVYILFALLFVALVGCGKDDDTVQQVTQIETTRIKSITYSSAVCVGYVTGTYSEKGVCVATSPMPTTDHRIASSHGGSQFEIALDDLVAGTTYYVRTYAMSNGAAVYSEQKQFTTVADNDPLLEFAGTIESSYTTATIEGYVVATGGNTLNERGLCYSENMTPTVDDTCLVFAGETGRMRADITDLVDGKTYYGRVYAKIGSDVYYSAVEPFATVEYEKPVPTIVAVEEIATTSITIGARVAVKNELPVTAMGLIWSQTNDVTTGTEVAAQTIAVGDYSISVENLEQGRTYYMWAYADNRKGRAYSAATLAKTKSDYAQITLDKIENVLGYSSTAEVSITDLGVHAGVVSDAGVCWSLSHNPTVADAKTSTTLSEIGTAAGLRMALLKPNTTYYARAYVVNPYGTTYSAERSFTTRVDLYGSMLLVGADGVTAPKFNAWQIIVTDVTSASATNVPASVLSSEFGEIYNNITTAISNYSGAYMNGVIYRLRPTTDGGVVVQMTLYYRTASKTLTSTGWMNIELIRSETDGTFRFGTHSAWTSNVYKTQTDENKAYLDALVDYFAAHSFYFEWSTADYQFTASQDTTTGPIRLVPVDDPDAYWSFATKNYKATDVSAIANPF